jgi:glycine cleavage system transcriptional repressor
MRSFVLAVTGRDRPGIVAELTRALLDHGLNLEDAEMAILRGHFAVMLVLAAPADLDEAALRKDLDGVRATVPLDTVSLTEVPALQAPAATASHAISVYGADHPGIVHAVSAALAERGVNITDLEARLTVSGTRPVYTMIMELELPAEAEPEDLRAALGEVGSEAGVDVSLREIGSAAL